MSELEKAPITRDISTPCAETGDIDELYSLIHNHPNFLQNIDKLQFVTTPLHEAAAAGQTRFVAELMSLQPSLGRKLDPHGLSPLHVALRGRHWDTVKALVRIDRQLVRVKGRDGLTPLHYAVRMMPDLDVLGMMAGLDVLVGFLINCPDSINDLNSRFQSALHVAAEVNNCEAITLLSNWLARRARMAKRSRDPVLGWRDEKGNSALHVAVQGDCVQGVKIMVGTAKLNKRNSDDETALDIALRLGKSNMVSVLEKAGAKRSRDLLPKQTQSQYFMSRVTPLENLLHNYYAMVEDLLSNEVRSVVLVVAILIATATYQAVLQPPGGVYQGDANKVSTPVKAVGPQPPATPHLPGKMLMAGPAFIQFMSANTLAFTLSVVMIIFVLHGKPYNLILYTCLLFLAHSYLIAISFISDSSGISDILFALSWSMIAAAFLAKMLYYVPFNVDDVWWAKWLPMRLVSCNTAYVVVDGEHGRKTVMRVPPLRRQRRLIHA